MTTMTTNNWRAIKVASAPAPSAAPSPKPSVGDLREAGRAFADRTDPFAQGKASTCFDLANKLHRFGSYASEKQQQFAAKLVEWSKPRQPAAASPYRSSLPVPKLFSIMQGLADLYIGQTKISRKNQDSLCWVLNADALVGKIENGELVVFPRKAADAGCSVRSVIEAIAAIEANPLEAAKAAGRASGRCAVCGRDLTEPGSIEAGIGPVCLSKIA